MMKTRKIQALVSALLFLISIGIPQGAFASAKRRIAILPFEYGAVTSEVGTVDVGKGINSLLVTKLVNDGTYSVVDRQMLDAILKEQNLSVSDRADPATACKIGKILSVDAIIVGTVTQFGFESHYTNVGAGASVASSLAGSYIPFGLGGLAGGLGHAGVKKSRAKVSIDARIIDINTTEILAAVHGSGESKRSSTSLFGGGGSGGSGGFASWDSGSSDFATSIAGEATLQAVDEIGSQLIAFAGKIPDGQSIAAQNVEGKVADVTGGAITLNVGKVNGLAKNDKMQVQRVAKTIKDPDTGKVLKEISNTVAVINLDEVDQSSATGSIVKGSGVRVGDAVKKVTTDVSAIVIAPAPGAGSDPSSMTRTFNATGTILNGSHKTH
ncbi:MAG: curli production assembly protein CsgG [Cyanobacteria bacterium SZAS LIN-2]|nr:curli production assembly protein CsgG [Cyanobacteria bacterium SZAS LIN-3]MBS1995728.1 curli production assembly protein CsgG [Cyanobacteria bacterium SZAS LIN-2]MBS2006893.1 curli production assembly protein CsgG [Cyanobacteria bacterium SZAS TMP-1]